LVPAAMPGFAGVIVREISVAGFTVSKVDPDILPDVALIVVEPADTEAARPELPTVATLVLDELQVTEAVKSCVELSVYTPVAMNC